MHDHRLPVQYKWSEAKIWRLIYDLMAALGASTSLQDIVEGDDELGLFVQNLKNSFEKNVITDSMVQLSVIYRMQQDARPGHDGKTGKDNVNPHHNNCGTFGKTGVEKPLTLREACNKTLHAHSIQFEYESFIDNNNFRLKPLVKLHCDDWIAVLDLHKFCNCLFFNFDSDY